MNLFFLSLIAFLPERYRRSLLHGNEVPTRAAIASGVVEVIIAMDLLVHFYFHFTRHWLNRAPDAVMYGAYSSDGEAGMIGVGAFLLISFVLQPLTIVLLFFAIEGCTRMVAGMLNGEITGSLPFWLIAMGQAKIGVWREEAKQGARIADEVENISSEGSELRISSCRAKPDWDDRVTIAYRQGLYEVAGQETGSSPRPFVYLLRPKPEFKVIRGLRHYSPDEVLKAKG